MSRLREEGGFTLVELLTVLALSLVIMGATLATFNGAEQTQRVNQDQNESQDTNRRALDAIARRLRNLASPSTAAPNAVEKNDQYDMIFQTVGATKPGTSLNDRNITRVRYCLGASSGGKATLWRQQQTWTSAAPPAVPSTASCPDAAWPVIAGTGDNKRALAGDIVNRELSQPTFSFNSSTLASINAVTIELLVDTNPGKAPAESRLASGVFLRNQNQAPVASATATDTGTGHRLLLNGSASEDPEGNGLTRYEWFADGDGTTTIATGAVAYWTSPGPAFPRTHSITLRVTDAGGRTAEQTLTGVTVN